VWNHTRVAIKVLMDGSGLIMGQEAQEEQALATISSPLLAKLVDVGACCAVACRAVPCRAVPCRAMPCCAVLCCAVLCCAVLCCAVLCCAVLCCAVRVAK
jgi:hypothetical protein